MGREATCGLYTVHTTTVGGVEEAITYCDEVLMATERLANASSIVLENAWVEMEGDKVNVDKFSKMTCDNIYAIADVTVGMQLTPVVIQRLSVAFLLTVFGNKQYAVDCDLFDL